MQAFNFKSKIFRKLYLLIGILFCLESFADTGTNIAFYFDLGEFYGAYLEGNWNLYFGTNSQGQTYLIETSLVENALTPLFNNLAQSGTQQLNLSFGQISNINDYYSGSGVNMQSSDPLGQIIYDNFLVGSENTTTGLNFVQYLINFAHTKKVRVDMSFGGQNASSQNTTILSLLGETIPTGPAVELAEFITSYGFDSIDFDIEGTSQTALFNVNTTSTVINFFTTLHDLLSQRGIPMYASFEGSLSNGPESTLAPLCQNFTQMFDGVNLMLYGGAGGQFYIDWDNSDASGVDWGINQWLTFVKNPAMIHIGFYNSISYNTMGASAGYQYTLQSGATSGQQAGYVYITMIGNLTGGLSKNNLGQPFWWTDTPQAMVSAPDPSATDFYTYITTH